MLNTQLIAAYELRHQELFGHLPVVLPKTNKGLEAGIIRLHREEQRILELRDQYLDQQTELFKLALGHN